ncbi:SusE domain-containing protein [Pontibacter toksunensis]|uniref:SusE domain-containing protein n=1 Tax=Pontibacter toksunensis TaxID=1332631 RepID=A0ABW6BQ51_9BACT
MKTWINRVFILTLCSFALISCEKDEERVTLRVGTAPVLTASTTNMVLLEEDAANDALTLSWNEADFGFDAAVNYVLEVDMKGNDFAAPVTADLGNNNEKTFTVAQLNTLVNKLDIRAFEPNELDMRIRASVSPNVTPVLTNSVTLSLTPYLTEPPYKTLYLIGAATDAGWDNTKAIAMLRDPSNLFMFTYTGKFKADQFKILGQRGSWAPSWGNGENGVLTFRETEGDPDPANIVIPSEGYYTVTVNLRNNTFTVVPYDASSKATYASIGIIGSFNGWGGIIPMEKSAFNPHYWTLEHTFEEDAELKFRIAPDWSVNWGAPAGTEDKLFNTTGNENIKIPAGTYKIIFNDLTGNYLFISQE